MNSENLSIHLHRISKRIDMEPEDEGKIKTKKIATDVCKALGIWDTIGKKWSLLILRHLSANDNMHFNELKRLLGISSNVLAKKLKQLEQEGLVTRRAVYENIPLRVEYKITPLAKELDAIFIGLEKWVAKWESRDELRY
jgi:DNA-binding HxlR family transcriptional regulator